MSPTRALLLPKLRSHYAEFLNHGSPDRLGMLYPPTCVGFGTGTIKICLEVFLGSMGLPTSLRASSNVSGIEISGFAYLSPYTLSRGRPEPRPATLLRHPIVITIYGGTGISTCCASATHHCLALAPD